MNSVNILIIINVLSGTIWIMNKNVYNMCEVFIAILLSIWLYTSTKV